MNDVTLETLFSLELMCNSSDDDFNIAASNIRNLKLNTFCIKLISKNIELSKRMRFLNEFGIDVKNMRLLSFNELLNEFKSSKSLNENRVIKDYFGYSIKKLIDTMNK
jgi:hypothetical protein